MYSACLTDLLGRGKVKYSYLVLMYAHSVKHSTDIKTSFLVQWLCNHSHKLHLALLCKFGKSCILEGSSDIEKSADPHLVSGGLETRLCCEDYMGGV